MLDEETVEYGVCLILAGLIVKPLPTMWDEMFRQSKEPSLKTLPYNDEMLIDGRPWISIQ